jgi:hypothetical protein
MTSYQETHQLTDLFSAENDHNFQTGRGGTSLLPSIQQSLGPIFDYFLAELEKQDGQTLDIRLTVEKNEVKLEYGVSPVTKP